ncbi:MAG: type II toxin-antitoxin system PemK/MazF family toxin [Acidimicrobiia bacterium]
MDPSTRGGDFYLATSGDLVPATSGDFRTATDKQGLPERSVIACDNVVTIPKRSLDRQPVGALSRAKRAELDEALRYALDIVY